MKKKPLPPPGSLEELIFWLNVQSGMKDPPKDHPEQDESKMRGSIEYGTPVIIVWDDADSDVGMPATEDHGYVMGLPGFDEADPEIGGVVHVPHPAGGEKCEAEPEWITIYQLCSNPRVVSVVFGVSKKCREKK